MINPGAADAGFHEVCAIVQDLDATIARLCAVFGYRELWRGEASPDALALMEIDPAWDGQEALIGDPAQGRGYIRLFSFPGRETSVMRDGAQPWDSGGIFDINVRALVPIEPLHAAMTRAGFRAFGPVTTWDFGPLGVKEVVEADADGLAIALIERFSPPLEGFESVVGPVSYVFNSTQIVQSFAQARAFYVDALGWKVVQESAWRHETGDNCIGLPLDVAKERELRVGIYQAAGENVGSVEILEYVGESLDFSQAAPPDRGWAALRFPMADIDGFLALAQAGGARILPRRRMDMAPYGPVDAGALITPWGVRMEVYAPA